MFLLVHRKFVKILTMMAEDWRDSADSDVDMRETTCKAKLSSRITNAMVTLHALAIVAYSSGIILADVDINDRANAPPLLLKVEVPIDIHSQLRYKVLLTAQFVYLLIAGCGAGLVNALLLTLVSCNCASIRYEQYATRGSSDHDGVIVSQVLVSLHRSNKRFFETFIRPFSLVFSPSYFGLF